MAGSANNITTQWTFRDGRDYILSLTATEAPNTLSVLITDRITGEEWTGCYDENCIELLTKRTGCFKSFNIFHAMIKSAILKKSESVVLELFNIQDLAAMSVHRTSSLSSDCGFQAPLNFEFYSDIAINGAKSKPHSTPSEFNSNSNGTANMSSGTNQKPPSPLNKRKYLIVSYVGEFDKVHYPLPLNYSNPPDLNVMQNTIIKLKAEVTSLKSSKKELEEHLESIRVSSGTLQHSHENNNNDVKAVTSISTLYQPNSSSEKKSSKEPVPLSQNPCRGEDVNPSKEEYKPETTIDGHRDAKSQQISCTKCSAKIKTLKAEIRDLENSLSSQRVYYYEKLEKLERENHFLRQKVDTAEKHESELWEKIHVLQEKVKKHSLDNDREIQVMKDAPKNRCRLSRHDLFYSMKNTDGRKPVKQYSSKSPIIGNRVVSPGLGFIDSRKLPYGHRSGRSKPKATTASSSDELYRRNRTNSKGQCRSNSSSSYHSINFERGLRTGSISPARRFDPTAYVIEKKLKQTKIADLRMRKIESRIRAGSAGSLDRRSKSPSLANTNTMAHLTRTTISPTTLFKSQKSLSGETMNRKNKVKMDEGDANSVITNYFTVQEDQFHRKIAGSQSRPSSAESCRTKTVSPSPRFSLGARRTDKPSDYYTKLKWGRPGRNAKETRTQDIYSHFPPYFSPELQDTVTQTPTKKPASKKLGKKKTNSIAVNTSFTCDHPDPLMTLETAEKSLGKKQTGKNDIKFLQEKLSALNAFLETCKTKD